ncbi:sensor histidine kinase [Microvirga sp. KLBC 81]|uniref:sensor histidine kinase n=1 Tax=Microvirga sp. KLBC 81 TaxID=1862707 RepID=UPI001401DBB6|nr:sensor histidine kinase [Microvirga sp. KLBC 81]
MPNQELHLTRLESEFERVLNEHAEGQHGERGSEKRNPAEEELRERARDRRFRQLLDALPAAVYTTDAAGRITFYNEAAAELWGCQPELGKSEWCGSWLLFWPDGTPLPHDECPMAVALKENRAIRGAEAVAERPDGIRVPFIPFPTPLHDASGKLVGAVNMLVDITDRKRAEDQQALLVRELHHRVKNMLATVQAIMGSTARASTTIEEFQQAFTGRIMALTRTHSSLAEDEWQAISIRNLLCNELEPYDDGSPCRVLLDGPAVELPSTTAISLGMAIHELTTNAVKYGALSVLGGSVAVSWALVEDQDHRELTIKWVERNGPAISSPTRKGFGSQLLERVLNNQIGAGTMISYEPDGLRAYIAIPLPYRVSESPPMNSLARR